MTSRQNIVSAAAAAAAAASQPGSSPILKQQQQQPQFIATSPRVNFMTSPDNNNNAGVVVNNGGGGPNNIGSNFPPGVANPLGGMALPLALLAQHQQLQMAAAVAGNQQGPPIYIYPPGIQPFPCYFPGAPLPYPHPGAPQGGPFSPAAATTAAIMAAMTAGVPHQNNQPLPGSPFFAAPGIGTPITPVFRFNQPQNTPQPPPPLPLSQAQSAPNSSTMASLPPHLDLSGGENRRTVTKASIGVGHDAILSPPPTTRLLPPPNGNDSNNNIMSNAALPVNNSSSNIASNTASLPPPFSSSAPATAPSPHQHHHSTSSLTSPSKPAMVISSPPGVNTTPSSSSIVGQQQHVIRQNPLSSHDNNAQLQHHHQHHHQSGQLQQQVSSSLNSSSNSSTSNRQRKRPPNLTIPISNFDVPPANSSMGSDSGANNASTAWPPNTPGGSNAAPVPKTPKTAPSLLTAGSSSSNNWPQQRTTPRGGLHSIASAGPRQRGRPPLHHKPQINSADLNGFPSVSSHNFSSSSSTYNSPNLLAAPVVNSANSYSTTGSDLSGHHQQEVVINSPSHLLYPDHFKRGSLIRLADGSFKCVEDMLTSDFTRSAQLSGELQLDSSQVLQIEPNPARGAAMLYLAVGDQSPINVIKIHVEAPLEHPFFVYNVGWSSCDPDRTRLRYGLSVSQLRVGDKCISLTRKPNGSVSVSSASAAPVTLPPPPPPIPARRTAQPQQPQAASAIVVEQSDDGNKQVSTSVTNKTESEAEMESIATVSLLSLQQSSTKMEAVSPLLRISSAAVPAVTITTTATTAVIRSTEPRQVSNSPPESSGGLLILDNSSQSAEKIILKEADVEPKTVESPKIEDQSSVASEPLVVDGVSSASPVVTTTAFENKTPHVKSQFATHNTSSTSKPRLLLFPGHQLVSSNSAPRPGSSSFVGLRRRRHRSTSALALAELSPKSKFILLQKEAAQSSRKSPPSANVKSPVIQNNNQQSPPLPPSEPEPEPAVVEVVDIPTSPQKQSPQQARLEDEDRPSSSSANDDDIDIGKQDSEQMQVDDDNYQAAQTSTAVSSDDNV